MDIKKWLIHTTVRLDIAGIPSARLDAELLLAFHLRKPREYLLAHPGIQLHRGLSSTRLNELIERRIKREPVAYILGEKEFYGRSFFVTPDVLIPRPESEVIIDLLKQVMVDSARIVDIGTGSGCLAVIAKLELPNAEVIATDSSEKALVIAQKNARKYNADVTFLHGSLLEPILAISHCLAPTILIANLPYIDKTWVVSPEIVYEPIEALYAKDKGLHLIRKLIAQSSNVLQKSGYLLLEADPRQHAEITVFARQHRLKLMQKKDFILVFKLIVPAK